MKMPVGAYKPEIPKWSQPTSNFNRSTTAPGSRSTWWGTNGKAPEHLKYIAGRDTANR